MKYEDLNIKDRAAIIKIGVLNGLTSLSDIRLLYNMYAEGGSIHIKPENKGKFTAAAKSRGMGVLEFASKVLANKENYSPTLVKRANFARNASKWKHLEGGYLFLNQDNTNKSTDEEYYTYMELLAKKKAKDWGEDEDIVLTLMLNDNSYNYRAFYDNNRELALAMLTANPNAHFTDIGKTVYHPTFSNESIYSGKVSDYNPRGTIGGSWNREGTLYKINPSLIINGDFNYFKTRDYLDRNESFPVGISFATGGPLYPFSFNKSIPEVRYLNGGNLFLDGGLKETLESNKVNEKKTSVLTTNELTLNPEYLLLQISSIGNKFLSNHPYADLVYSFIPVLGTIRGVDKIMEGDKTEIVPTVVSGIADAVSLGFGRPMIKGALYLSRALNAYKNALFYGMDDKAVLLYKNIYEKALLLNGLKSLNYRLGTVLPQITDVFINTGLIPLQIDLINKKLTSNKKK